MNSQMSYGEYVVQYFAMKYRISEKIIVLLNIDKKSELEKYCKNLIITLEELVGLIINCNGIGYLHEIKTHQFIPSHLKHTDEELNSLCLLKQHIITKQFKKFINKISQIFKERRWLIAHLFFNETKWHLFYFDQRDINRSKNHWKEGEHIHFVNYLWPQYSRDELWSSFGQKNTRIKDKLHIKFIYKEC